MNEVAIVQKERDDQLLMAENEKQEALHAAANEKAALLDKVNKIQNDLEESSVQSDRIKREAFSRTEQDKVGLVYLISVFCIQHFKNLVCKEIASIIMSKCIFILDSR